MLSASESNSLHQAIPVDQIRYDERGLVPAIVQDYLDGTVLMMAWMNQESLQKTLETGETWFWSRSRSQLWHKGETSGHLQKVRSLRYDCDSDCLLVTVEQMAILPVTQENGVVSIKWMGQKPLPQPIPCHRCLT
jgi:phosphoribosyl-ATP pyrophosphohydrolase/phosphoribosyl-AMP cyclohydrolase